LPKVMEVKPDATVRLKPWDMPPEEWMEEIPKVYLGEYTENSDIWIINGKIILFVREREK